jgi:hypothetical protein
MKNKDQPMDRIRRMRRVLKQLESTEKAETVDMKKFSPFEKLDLVLEYMETIIEPPFRTLTEIKNELSEKGIVFGKDSDELFRILLKLEADQMIHTEIYPSTDPNGTKRYFATFDGNLFLSQGGYYQKDLDTNLQRGHLRTLEEGLKRHNSWIRFAGVSAATIGALSLAFAVWRVYKENPHIFCFDH